MGIQLTRANPQDAFDILLIIVAGRIAFKVLPGESTGLVMEMADYHVPSLKVILKQTWARTKSLIIIVFPTYIVGSAAVQALYSLGILTQINNALMPNCLVAWTSSSSRYTIDIWHRKERDDNINTGGHFPNNELQLDHDSGTINCIGSSQYYLHSMPS